jgi:hypothetical protein
VQSHRGKVEFVKRHKPLLMKFKPWVFGWALKDDPLGQEILSLARKELDYSDKTYYKDILLSLMRISRSCDCGKD